MPQSGLGLRHLPVVAAAVQGRGGGGRSFTSPTLLDRTQFDVTAQNWCLRSV